MSERDVIEHCRELYYDDMVSDITECDEYDDDYEDEYEDEEEDEGVAE